MSDISTDIHLTWLYWGLVTAYFITILSIIGVVLSENRNPLKSLAWVTVLLMFPVGGVILYIFFGRSIKNKRMISRRNRRKLRQREAAVTTAIPASCTQEQKQQIDLGRSLIGAQFYPNNDIKIYHYGAEKFQDMLTDIANASKYILLQYYIFEDDVIGNKVRNLLIDRAKHGVKVRVIYDHIGCIGVKSRFFREMKQAGIEVHPFFRVAFPPFATRINWRNHRKICVIDGHIGYIGGMNIADRYIDGGEKFKQWRIYDTYITHFA